MVVDQGKLDAFIGKAISEWGAAAGVLLVFVGDKLGLFKAMSGAGPMSPEDLARKTGTHARVIKEWLSALAAGGYVTYNPKTRTYLLPEEQAFALTEENSPAYVAGAFQVFSGLFKDEEKILQAFKTGKGLGWGDHHHDLFEGTERFFKPGYIANITSSWIPALEGVDARLKKGGAKIADVGCGHGASTLLMAKAYPHSKIVGFDYQTLRRLGTKTGREGTSEERQLRSSRRNRLSRQRLRPRSLLRLPPRHGKPFRSGGPRAPDTEAEERHVDDRRAIRA
jgi:hypothetical protein